MKLFQKSLLIRLMSFWPPFLGAGIRVKKVSADFRSIHVEMKLRFWNQNYVSTQFGGSLYAMVDPFYMLMLIENLGHEYIVWDKAATIRFKKPGAGTVRAHFELSEAQINELKAQADSLGKIEPMFKVEIKDPEGNVIAEAEKVLYIRKKTPKTAAIKAASNPS